MKIGVFGLGYVGTVSAACLAQEGHAVVAVDTNVGKVDLVNQGVSPIVERGVPELIDAAVRASLLSATTSCSDAVATSTLAFVCVGTPSRPDGDVDLSHVERVCSDVGNALRGRSEYFVIAIRSTLMPGTTHRLVIPTVERTSGKRAGRDFGVCVVPEFLREGTAVSDYFNPSRVVVGAIDDRTLSVVEAVIRREGCPFVVADVPAAEVIKYVDNSWHALKVAFSNEVGTFAKECGIDGREVMRIFSLDTKLNLSTAYLRPGLAFGGSCLPKDVRALSRRGRSAALTLPVLDSILESNRQHLDRVFRMIMETGNQNIGIVGLAFKSGTDDLRESPMVELVERLIGKGKVLRIFDDSVNVAQLTGTNREYILRQIPHIAQFLARSLEEVLVHGDTLVVARARPEVDDLLSRLGRDSHVVDLTGDGGPRRSGRRYSGICW